MLVTSTRGPDGRYLVDLRYLPGEPDPEVVRHRGIYLNRQLLEERLDRRYQGRAYIAALTDSHSIGTCFEGVGLPARAPPVAPARPASCTPIAVNERA